MISTDQRRRVLYLIDGSAYVYRAFFALPPLNNSKGFQTNAIYGFTTTLTKIIREHKPDGLAVAFDERGPTIRHAEFKAYKAQRPPMPEGMQTQVPYIHRLVEAFSIPVVREAGYEADDLIGTLARQAEHAGYDVVIVTGDKDMFQLLTPHTRIFDPVKNKWSGEAEARAVRCRAVSRRRSDGTDGRQYGQHSRREGNRRENGDQTDRAVRDDRGSAATG